MHRQVARKGRKGIDLKSLEAHGYYCSGDALNELKRIILCIGNVLGDVAVCTNTGEKPKFGKSAGTVQGSGKPRNGVAVLPRTMAHVLKEGKAKGVVTSVVGEGTVKSAPLSWAARRSVRLCKPQLLKENKRGKGSGGTECGHR